MGNQILLLHDKQVDDGDTLDSLDITSSATFILLRRAPLLSGAINREDLDHLLQDINVRIQRKPQMFPDRTTWHETMSKGLFISFPRLTKFLGLRAGSC